MKTLCNIFWHVPFLGFVSAGLNYILGVLLTITVVAAPIGFGLMEYGKFLFWPFGNAIVSKKDLKIQQNVEWKNYSTLAGILYLPIGIVMFACGLVQVLALFCTIIGIPYALIIAKSLGTYFNPVNKKCVNSAVRDEIAKRKEQEQIEKYLNFAE